MERYFLGLFIHLFSHFLGVAVYRCLFSQSRIRHPKAQAAVRRLKAAAKVYLSKLRLLAAAADQAVQAAAGSFSLPSFFIFNTFNSFHSVRS